MKPGQNFHRFSLSALLIAAFLQWLISPSCSPDIPLPSSSFSHSEANGIYFWKTDFRLDSAAIAFLHRHTIRKMYVRFFDVVAEDYYADGEPMILPNATIRFTDTVPAIISDVIPSVYITLEALRCMEGAESDAASKIVRRVLNMVSFNAVPNVSELQLDCDWTATTRDTYFSLCREISDTLAALTDSTFTLSSTIRLHQLSQSPPPVDYGVLMCYNTGSFRNQSTENSILDYKEVAPYFRTPVSYPLHLDLAFPAYDWKLLYRNQKFIGILHGDSVSVELTDSIRHEKSDPDVIMRVKQLIDRALPTGSVILYHLDSRNLNRFSDHEISEIFRRDSI